MSTATDMLANYLAAEVAILKGQAYSINGHSYTRTDLQKVQEGRSFWQAKVDKENSGVSGNSSYSLANFT